MAKLRQLDRTNAEYLLSSEKHEWRQAGMHQSSGATPWRMVFSVTHCERMKRTR